MKSIFLKEIRSFFSSLVAYVVIILFLLVCGLFMWVLPDTNIPDYGIASMERFFSFAPYLLMFLIPALTMRTFADEYKSGTIELLSTKPLRENDIIYGKFWASMFLVVICILPTFLYILTLESLAVQAHNLDTGGIIGSYTGLFFLIAAFTAIGLFASSLTDNQIIGFLVGLFLNFVLYMAFETISKIEALSGGADYIISQLGLQFHYKSISRGVLDTRDILYFISITVLFLLATRLFLQKRKWGPYSRVNNRKKQITRFALLGFILLCFNFLGSKLHKRFDLTAERRFSLSPSTKTMLKELKKPVLIDVYLKGKFPAGFQRLHDHIADILNEFKEVSNGKVKYSFVNPLEGKTENEKKSIFETLARKGIQPVNLQVQLDESEGQSQQIIFPAAIVSHNAGEYPVNLLENKGGLSPDEKLEYSGTLLEYKFAKAIYQTASNQKPDILYAVGNGENIGWNTFDMLSRWGFEYHLDTIDINTGIEIPVHYKALIINNPKTALDEKTKFRIDQYIMNGGNVLWLIDRLNTGLDTLEKTESYLAVDKEVNIEDMLFHYGVRVNPDLVEDYLQNVPIPVTVGMIDNRPDIRMLPWLYFPFAVSTSSHPIVSNLDAVMFQFANSIDTVGTDGNIRKTVLLHSSNRSRKMPAPLRISLSTLRFKPQEKLYREKNIPLAVLLEGNFTSIFTNRLSEKFLITLKDSLNRAFLPQSKKPGKQIIVSSSSVMNNDFSDKHGPMPTGFYKYTEQTFANRPFLMNCLEYLTDREGLLESRSKELTTRLLDMERVRQEKLKWQLVNIGLPILLTLIFGSGFFFFRRKKYTGKTA